MVARLAIDTKIGVFRLAPFILDAGTRTTIDRSLALAGNGPAQGFGSFGGACLVVAPRLLGSLQATGRLGFDIHPCLARGNRAIIGRPLGLPPASAPGTDEPVAIRRLLHIRLQQPAMQSARSKMPLDQRSTPFCHKLAKAGLCCQTLRPMRMARIWSRAAFRDCAAGVGHAPVLLIVTVAVPLASAMPVSAPEPPTVIAGCLPLWLMADAVPVGATVMVALPAMLPSGVASSARTSHPANGQNHWPSVMLVPVQCVDGAGACRVGAVDPHGRRRGR